MYIDSIFDYVKMAGVDGSLQGAAGILTVRVEELQSWSQWRKTGKFPDDDQIAKIAALIQWDINDAKEAFRVARLFYDSVILP